MSDYERSTKEMTLGSLPEPVAGALRAKAESLQLTLTDDAQAFLTHSRKRKQSGLLARVTRTADPDSEHLTALVIGARDVLVATSGERRGTQVMAARLDDVELHDLRIPGVEVPDDGVSVDGFPVSGNGTSGRGSLWVGLGPPAGAAARAALEEAVRKAKA